ALARYCSEHHQRSAINRKSLHSAGNLREVRFDGTRLDRGGQQPLLLSKVNPKQWTPLCAHITPSLLLRQTIRRRRRDMMFEKKIYSQDTFLYRGPLENCSAISQHMSRLLAPQPVWETIAS